MTILPDSEGYSSKSDLILAAVRGVIFYGTVLEMEKRTKKEQIRVRYASFDGNVMKIKTASGDKRKKKGNRRVFVLVHIL